MVIFIISVSFVLYILCVILHALKLAFCKKNVTEKSSRRQANSTVRTMIIMGSGGHTAEMLRLLDGLDLKKFSPRTYVVARTDDTSVQRVKQLETSQVSTSAGCFQIRTISRTREVHQSWLTTVFSFLTSTLQSLQIIFSFKPDLILCNGPGTCVPPCLISFVLKALWLRSTSIVFVESICRVRTLSLTGKIMSVLADRSVVQWPELHEKYPNTVYLNGRIV